MVVHGALAVRERTPRPIRHALLWKTLLQQLTTEECPATPADYDETTSLAQYVQQHGGRVVDDDADPYRLGRHLALALQTVLPTLPSRYWQEASVDASAEGLAQSLATHIHSKTNIDMTTSVSAFGDKSLLMESTGNPPWGEAGKGKKCILASANTLPSFFGAPMSLSQIAGLYSRIPRPVRHELHRLELLSRLQHSDVPLVVLRAPGGYGKTTLLAQFARSAPGRVIWLSGREEDADPLLLCDRIVGAVAQVLPTLSLTRSLEGRTVGKPPALLATALAADLAYSTTNLDVILDGADTLGTASGKWLGAWVDELPEGHRVFVSARTALHLGLPRRVAAATATLLDVHDLAFNLEETAACLQAAASTANPVEVYQRLEGWPLAVNVTASGHEVHLSVRDVLQDALEHLPVDVLAGLPELGVLDVWTEKHALDLGLCVPPGWLDVIRQAGLPLTPIADALRPHALLRDQLEELLLRDKSRHAQLHGLAGEQAEAQGQEWQALTHYRLAGHHQAHLRLARMLALRYQERWEPRLTVQALDTLPASLITEELFIILGKALIDSGDVKRGRTVIQRLHDQGIRHPDVFFVMGALAARAGEDEHLLTLAEEGLACPHDIKEACRLLRLKATALFNLGRPVDALPVAQSALSLARGSRDLVEVGAVLDIVQVIHKAQREWPECEAALRAALHIYADAGMPSRSLMIQNNLADLLLRQGRYVEALELVSEALPVAEREQSVVLGLLLETLGEILSRQGQDAGAHNAFQRALAVYEEFEIGAFISRTWPALTEMTLRCGDVSSLRSLISQWELTAPPQAHAYQALRLCKGLLAFHAGQWADAAAAFREVKDGEFTFRAALLAAGAACHAGAFDCVQAEHTQTMLDQAQPHQFWPSDVSVLKEVAAACHSLGVTLECETPLLEALTATLHSSGDPTPPLLQIQTLGQVSVLVDGVPVHMPLSRSAEVLAWLAFHGGGTRGDIMNDLWDGSSEQRHIEYFKVAVRHLRVALASAPAVTFNPLPYERGHYRLAPEFRVELDALLPSRVLNQPTDEGLRRLVDAYRGPFLPASDTGWADTRRTELLDQTLSAGLMLAERLQHEHPGEALTLLEQCLKLDPLQEATHLHLILLWEALGEPEAARRCYSRYARMLSEEWRRQPSRELQARYAQR